MKICVYTCITGNYDKLKEIEYKNEKLDYLCFTNNKSLVSNTWKIVYVDEPLDNLLLQRKIKILCCQYLKTYDVSLYIDGKVMIRKDVLPFIHDNLKRNVDLVGFNHFERDCIYDELYVCILYEKESLTTGMRIYDKYQSEGFPRHYGLSDTAILLRQHTDAVAGLMDQWFHMVESYSRRDQLSLFYCLWKNPVSSCFLEENIFDNEFFATDRLHHAWIGPSRKRCLADFNPEGSSDPALLAEGAYMSGMPEVVVEFTAPTRSDSVRIFVNELGNRLIDYSTNSDLKAELIYGIPLDQDFLLMNNHFLRITGDLEEGRTFQVKLKIKELSRNELTELFYQSNSQRIESILHLQKEIKTVQGENVALKQEITRAAQEIIRCQQEITRSTQELAAIKTSFSFKVGRTMTWIPRKLRGIKGYLRKHVH